jgi:hypothetical protein
MNIYEKRWLKAKSYFERLNKIVATKKYTIMFSDMFLEKGKIFDINETEKLISISQDNIQWIIYNGDPTYDEGVLDKIEDTLKSFKDMIKVYAEVDWAKESI